MRPVARLPLARRRDRGFSLLELGVVVAVAAVLMAGVTAGVMGLTRHARAKRTVDEIYRLVPVAQGVVSRTLEVKYVAGKPVYYVGGTALPDAASSSSMRSVDLSAVTSADPLYDAFKQFLGAQNSGAAGSGISNEGRNAYVAGSPARGQPYKIYMNSARLEVRTCVDKYDYEDYSAFRALADCTDPCPNDPATKCVAAFGPILSARSQRLWFSYDDYLFRP